MTEQMTTERIAKNMFYRSMADYHYDPSLVEQMWHEDPGVPAFWIAQAIGVIDDVRRTCMVCHPDLQKPCELEGQLTIEDVIEP